jgi:toxin-antitoxin system PIN domain toxin
MPKFSRLFLFPDVNVWIALTFRGHVHYSPARAWLDSVPDEAELYFCRLTQISFLRLLTTSAVMGNQTQSQAAAWETYDYWLHDGRASYIEEPLSIERTFRATSGSDVAAPKDWADAYVSAFAQVCGLQLVTLDQTLHKRTSGSILVRS